MEPLKQVMEWPSETVVAVSAQRHLSGMIVMGRPVCAVTKLSECVSTTQHSISLMMRTDLVFGEENSIKPG